MKAGSDFEQARDAALRWSTRPSLGSVMRERIFRSVTFAGAVAADDADNFAALDLEADVLERPEILLGMARHDGAAAQQIHRARRANPRAAAGHHVAQRHIALALRGVADHVFLAKAFGADDDIAAHERATIISDHVREGFFGTPEVEDAEPEEEHHDGKAHEEARHVELALPAEQAPAEAVDHSDDRIEAVPEAPFVRNDRTRKADRRDIKTELHDERDDVAEVTVFNVERGQQKRGSEARQDGEEHKGRQEYELPARAQAKPGQQQKQQHEINPEVDQRHDRGRGGNNDARKIDLADEVGVGDETIRGLAQNAGNEKPRQHPGENQDRIGHRAVARKLGELAENDREDRHGQSRPHNRPDDADHGLLVTHRDVAPREDGEEFAIGPDIAPVVAFRSARFENQHAGRSGSLLGLLGYIRQGRPRTGVEWSWWRTRMKLPPRHRPIGATSGNRPR